MLGIVAALGGSVLMVTSGVCSGVVEGVTDGVVEGVGVGDGDDTVGLGDGVKPCDGLSVGVGDCVPDALLVVSESSGLPPEKMSVKMNSEAKTSTSTATPAIIGSRSLFFFFGAFGGPPAGVFGGAYCC